MRTGMSMDELLPELVRYWQERCEDLTAYLHKHFGVLAGVCHTPKRLILVRMSDGRIAKDDVKRHIIGRTCHTKWVVEAGITRVVPCAFEWKTMYNTDHTSTKYLTPSFLFFVDNDEVLLSERFGPDLVTRLIGRWNPSSVPHIVWNVLWRYGSTE